MHPAIFLCASAALLAGCAAAPAPSRAPDDATIYRGHLVMTPQMQVFVPCHTEEPLWVVAAPATTRRLLGEYETLVRDTDEEAFAVLRGAPGAPLACAWCRDFPGSFQVVEVLDYRRARADDCH